MTEAIFEKAENFIEILKSASKKLKQISVCTYSDLSECRYIFKGIHIEQFDDGIEIISLDTVESVFINLEAIESIEFDYDYDANANVARVIGGDNKIEVFC